MLWPEFAFSNQGMCTYVTALACRNSPIDDLKIQLERISAALFDKQIHCKSRRDTTSVVATSELFYNQSFEVLIAMR